MIYRLTALILICLSSTSWAQSVYAPLNADYYHLVDRQEILNRDFSPSIHSSFKPYKRSDIAKSLTAIGSNSINQKYLSIDNWEYTDKELAMTEKPFWKWFYRTHSDMLLVDNKDFLLKLSPVIYLSGGRDDNSSSTPFINTRGIELRGMIDEKIGFYSFIGENQAVFPQYTQDYIFTQGAVPHQGFWKKFGDSGGVDYLAARGYFTFNPTKHITLQFGHDYNFIGNGYRSLLLSDFAAPSTFLKLQTKIWRLQYTNLYTELIADAPFSRFGNDGVDEFPKKFMTAHHLSWNITDNLNVGVFETILFNRGDSTGTAFEWNYLNPIIFYRSAEQYTGSPDNALFGMDIKWNITRGVQLYGQGILDELVVSELRANNGWWANKFAVQLGGKYFDAFGVKQLDLQVEYNRARPFTYSHESIFTSYTHYRQPLAHPLGANFQELVGIVRYQPTAKIFLSSKFIFSEYGTDPEGQVLGGDIFKDNTTRTREFGNTQGQGVGNTQIFLDFTASYMLKQNLFIDLRHIYRDRNSDDVSLSSTTNFSSLAIRLNIAAIDFSY